MFAFHIRIVFIFGVKSMAILKPAAFLLLLAGLTVAVVRHAIAQTSPSPDFAAAIEIPSSPNPVGSGARALGMGGAFIAVADDATAASWNPGGLIQLEKPEISIVGAYVGRTEDKTLGAVADSSAKQSIDYTNLNYLSIAYPFQLFQRNMIVSLNYQNQYNFDRNLCYSGVARTPSLINRFSFTDRQTGDLYATGLAYSFEVNPDLTFGVTLNYWGDFIFENKWKQVSNENYSVQIIYPEPSPFCLNITQTRAVSHEYHFDGWNANVGFLWRLSEHWTVGGVFKSPFTAGIKDKKSVVQTTYAPDSSQPPFHWQAAQTYHEKMTMPMSYGLGAAWRISDALTFSADIYRTHWEDFSYTNSAGKKRSPISGRPHAEADIDPTTWLRFGGEYLFIAKKWVIPLRAGLFYDPYPAEGSPDDYYGMSIGSGIGFDRLALDVAYQFRFGNDVGASLLPDVNFSQDVREHTIYASVIWYF